MKQSIISGKRANEEWGFNAVFKSLDLRMTAVLAWVLQVLGPAWVLLGAAWVPPPVPQAPVPQAQELMNGKHMKVSYAQLWRADRAVTWGASNLTGRVQEPNFYQFLSDLKSNKVLTISEDKHVESYPHHNRVTNNF